MSDRLDETYSEFGVLFVPGFAEQRPGGAIASFATALYRWLFRWNSGLSVWPAPLPVLGDTNLSATGDEPAHLTLAAPLYLSTGERDARWLLAESSWADHFTPPGFLGIARWFWKVSTCLLVLQFVIPMRRHWRRAGRPGKPWQRTLADRVIAPCYLVPMAVAAMASVMLSGLLFVLALIEKLPIPRIDKAVRWVAVKMSAVLGDSYMLAHCPAQFAAMQTQVARDLRWLQDHCDKVAIVAHSQGAAIAHQVLREGGYRQGNLRAFVTLGQGITKLHVLRSMDWDPQLYWQAWWSRLLVTTGMLLAGLPPALNLPARHWKSAVVLKTLVSMPVSGYLVCAGFVIIGIGLRMAMQAVSDEDREEHQALPNDGFSWRDYYASADPVSNGPLRSGSGQGVWYDQTRLLPDSCNQVYNSASVLYDHNRYLRNQDQLLSRLLNDLAAAAYDDGPAIVCEDDLRRAGRRRHRLVLVLIACRILSVGLAAWLWLADLGPHLEDPMNWVMGLFVPHAHMNEGLARFAAALLIATVVYLVFVSAWRIREEHVVRRFFRTTQRPWRAEQAAGLWVTGQAAGLRTAEQAARPAVRQEISAAIG